MDEPLFAFIRDWLWAPVMGLIAWAWTRNEKEHEKLAEQNDEIRRFTAHLREQSSMGYSTLNDRIMDHIDAQVKDTRQFVQTEDTKIIAEVSRQREITAKIFDKLEDLNRRSDDRHAETMNAIHTLAMAMHEGLAKKADK